MNGPTRQPARALAALGVVAALLVASLCSAFRIVEPGVHQGITFSATYFRNPRTVARLMYFVKQTDRWYEEEPRAHFDRELMDGGSEWIANHFNAAAFQLSVADKSTALQWYGVALHGLQDFYSHSNWVENHLAPGMVPSTMPTMPDLLTLTPGGMFAPGAAHANPNFTTTSDPALDCDQPPGPALDPYQYLTSGYYPNDDYPDGKCAHRDLNKDYNSTIFNPNSYFDRYNNYRGAQKYNTYYLYDFARSAATDATHKLHTEDMPTALARRFGSALGEKLYDYLIYDPTQMAFLVDESSSMAGYLPYLKTAINNQTAEMATWSNSMVLQLETFNEGLSDWRTSRDRTEFTGWVNGLQAETTDQHEIPLSAIDFVVQRIDRNGFLMVMTDTVPAEVNPALERQIIENAKRKNLTIGIFSPGAGEIGCNCAYQRIVAATGGFLFGRVNFSALLAEKPTRPHADGYFPTLTECLDEIARRADPRRTTFAYYEDASPPDVRSVPVDDSVGTIEFALQPTEYAFANVTLAVRRPNGLLVQPGDPDAVVRSNYGFQSVQVNAPAPGSWNVEVSGTNGYRVVVTGMTNRLIADVGIGRVTTSSGPHVLDVPIAHDVAVNDTIHVDATLSVPLDSPTFELVSLDGATVLPLSLSLDEGSGSSYQGPFQPTSAGGPYLLRVTGQRNGTTVQRVLWAPLEFSTLDIRPVTMSTRMAPSCSGMVSFSVKNLGADGTFSLTARSEKGLTLGLAQPSVSLSSGASAVIDVNVTTPADSELIDDVLLSATSDADPTVSNIGAGTVVVTQACDVFCVDCNHNNQSDACDIALGSSQDTNHNGVPDECESLAVPASSPGFRFLGGAPNPFSSDTHLRFAVAKPCWATLTIYDVRGRFVARIPGRMYAPGVAEATWDGRAAGGERAANGVYLVRFEAAGHRAEGKILIHR